MAPSSLRRVARLCSPFNGSTTCSSTCRHSMKSNFPEKKQFIYLYKPVLRINDILVWIRIGGAMPLTNWSGSCYFRHWPSRRQQKTNLRKSASWLLKVHLYHFSKKSQNSRNQGFSCYFCLMKGGSGSGSIPLTNGSGFGSRRPKNKRIQRILIRDRIRIRNPGLSIHTASIC